MGYRQSIGRQSIGRQSIGRQLTGRQLIGDAALLAAFGFLAAVIAGAF